MRKWALILLSVLMIFSLTACSSEQEEQNDTNDTSNQITETVDKEDSTTTVDEEQPTPTEVPNNTVWNDKDFEVFGIFDMEPLDIGEYSYYSAPDTKLYTVSVDWMGDFNFDFDLITQDAKALFEKTKKIGGRNGSIVFDVEAGRWVFDEAFETFEETYDGWQEESFYAGWYYEYNDMLISVSYSGGIDEKDGPYCGFCIFRHLRGDEE